MADFFALDTPLVVQTRATTAQQLRANTLSLDTNTDYFFDSQTTIPHCAAKYIQAFLKESNAIGPEFFPLTLLPLIKPSEEELAEVIGEAAGGEPVDPVDNKQVKKKKKKKKKNKRTPHLVAGGARGTAGDGGKDVVGVHRAQDVPRGRRRRRRRRGRRRRGRRR